MKNLNFNNMMVFSIDIHLKGKELCFFKFTLSVNNWRIERKIASMYYYLINFIYNDRDYFCIWYTNNTDGFLIENKCLILFETLNEIISYCKKNRIDIAEKIEVFDIDKIIFALSEDDFFKDLEYSTILNFWNIITDLSSSLSITFDSKKNNDIYEKIFYANNIKTLSNEDNGNYIPTWNNFEINVLRSILNEGVYILKSVLK